MGCKAADYQIAEKAGIDDKYRAHEAAAKLFTTRATRKTENRPCNSNQPADSR